MIIQHESCPYCDARLLKEYETCPHCNGPLGKTKIEFVEQYKQIDTLYRWGGDFGEIYFAVKYADGSKRQTKFDLRDLMYYQGFGYFDRERMENYIVRELCVRFDIDPMQLERFRKIDLNDYSNYAFTK